MVQFFRSTLAAALLALTAHASLAQETNPLLGKWILKGPEGALVTEFTDTTMSFTALGANGRPTGAPKTAQVKAYRKLTESYEIDLASGGTFVAAFEDPNTLHLYVPGTPDTARYTRLNQ